MVTESIALTSLPFLKGGLEGFSHSDREIHPTPPFPKEGK